MNHRDTKGRYIKGHKSGMTGKAHLAITKEKMSTSRRKIMKDLPYYKGGINQLIRRLYDSSLYRQWRKLIFNQDNYVCQFCGETKGRKEAHHKTMFSELFEKFEITTYQQAYDCKELWLVNNGLTLCEKCHNLTKRGNPNLYS